MTWSYLCLLLCIHCFYCVHSKTDPASSGPMLSSNFMPRASPRAIRNSRHEHNVVTTGPTNTIPLHYDPNTLRGIAPRRNPKDVRLNKNISKINHPKSKRDYCAPYDADFCTPNCFSTNCNNDVAHSLSTPPVPVNCDLFQNCSFVPREYNNYRDYISATPVIENCLSPNNIEPTQSFTCPTFVQRTSSNTQLTGSSVPRLDKYSITQSELSSYLNGITNLLIKSVCAALPSNSVCPESAVVPYGTTYDLGFTLSQPITNSNKQFALPIICEESNILTFSPCQENILFENCDSLSCTPITEDVRCSTSSPYAKEIEELLKIIIFTELMHSSNSKELGQLDEVVKQFEH